MATDMFLAMTGAEIGGSSCLPPKIGWMACHFSPYAVGLSNRPKSLPPGSLLILNDITPIHGHDGEVIAAQLRECVEKLKCSAVLLDFQRPDYEESARLAAHLVSALPCPVIISEPYAANLDSPVFLPPVPHHVSLGDWLSPWKGREIWLEAALDGEVITLTESGADIAPLPPGDGFEGGHREETLHCHYHIAVSGTEAQFTLRRTKEDLDALLEEAESLGVSSAVGLYQELRQT